MGFVSFPDKDLDALQLGGTLIWGPPPEVRYNQELDRYKCRGGKRGRKRGVFCWGFLGGENVGVL